MDYKIAKELIHLCDWLSRVETIVELGEQAYLSDPLLQEAGDSLMMKIGEVSGRLARAGMAPPAGINWADAIGNRNWVIHQYDEIDREITWNTLSDSVISWAKLLEPICQEAEKSLASEHGA